MDATHEYKRPAYQVLVYPNRVEVNEPKVLFAPPKKTMIMLRAISTVEQSSINHELSLVTTDGKKHKVLVYGKESDELRDAIYRAMAELT